MATNNILGFCTGSNPNVTPLATWQAKPSRTSGFVSGIAISSDINASIAGGANIAHAVGEFIKNQLNEDVNPTDETALVSQFLRSLQVFIQRGGACPVGSIIPYLGGDIPYGWLLANGASVLRSQYDKLFGLIGTKFGAVDEAHFNLPNLHHRFIEGTTTLSEVGSYIAAGLPNIKGFLLGYGIGQISFKQGATGGPFSVRNYELNKALSTITSTAFLNQDFDFDASKASNIYKNNLSEVNVNGLFTLCLVRAY